MQLFENFDTETAKIKASFIHATDTFFFNLLLMSLGDCPPTIMFAKYFVIDMARP